MSRRCIVVAMAAVLSAMPAHAQSRRVAVLDFASTAKDPTVEWLGPAVAETITTKLAAIRSLHLIERAQLYRVLQEQKLNLADLVDPAQAIRVGKLLGAEQVVLGGYTVFGGTVRFTARFVDVATGTIVATSQVNGLVDPRNPNGLWSAFDRLAQAAIESLNTRVAVVQGLPTPVPVAPAQRIEPTPEERVRLAKAPTKSLEAQEAFGRGSAAYKRHQWPEAARAFERATALDPDYAEAWHELGVVLERLGRWDHALAVSRTASQLYARLGDDRGQARAMRAIGIVNERQGRFAEARSYFEGGLRLAERLGDDLGRSRSLRSIGIVLDRQGHYAEALAHFEQSLRLAEKLGNESDQASNLHSIGIVYDRQGRHAEALTNFERALRLEERLSDEPGQVKTLNSLGVVQFSLGRYLEAISYLERSLRLAEKLSDEPDRVLALLNIGLVRAKQGHYAEALSYYEQSLRLAERLGDEPRQALSLNNIGSVHEKQGRGADALRFYERALEIAERLGMAERELAKRNRDRARSKVQ